MNPGLLFVIFPERWFGLFDKYGDVCVCEKNNNDNSMMIFFEGSYDDNNDAVDESAENDDDCDED